MTKRFRPNQRFVGTKECINRQSTLEEFEKDFIISREGRGCSEATISTYRDNFKRLRNFFATETDVLSVPIKVTALGMKDILTHYRRYLEKQGYSIHSIDSSLRHYRAIAYYAMEMGLISQSRIQIKAVPFPVKETFSAQDLEKLAKKPKTGDFVDYRTWVMVHYLSSTANRISSILGLKVGDIDFENSAITVRVQKNKVPRRKPLIATLSRVLKEYISLYRSDAEGRPLWDEPLFCSRFGSILDYNSAYDAFRDYFADRGVEFNGFHKFRHTFGANWIREGGNPFMLKEVLDHRTLAMTNRYANLYGMATKDESERFSLSRKLNPKEGRRSI